MCIRDRLFLDEKGLIRDGKSAEEMYKILKFGETNAEMCIRDRTGTATAESAAVCNPNRLIQDKRVGKSAFLQ